MPEQFATFYPYGPSDHQQALRVTTIGIDFRYEGVFHSPAGSDELLFVLFCSDTEALVDGAGIPCPAGSFMAWPAGAPLHYGRRGDSFLHHWLRCVGHQPATWFANCSLPWRRPLRLPWPAHGCDPWFRALRDECSRGPEAKDEIAAHLLRILFMEVERSRLDRGAATPGPLMRAKWHIEAHFREHIDVDGLAAIAGLSRGHFSTRFHETFDQAPLAYAIHLRMRHAALLLANADLRIAEVGAAVGYDDPFHFSKLFRKHHGLSPRAYRTNLSAHSD